MAGNKEITPPPCLAAYLETVGVDLGQARVFTYAHGVYHIRYTGGGEDWVCYSRLPGRKGRSYYTVGGKGLGHLLRDVKGENDGAD